MFKFVIVFISILWASLMLISWSGATPAAQPPVSEIVTSSSLPS